MLWAGTFRPVWHCSRPATVLVRVRLVIDKNNRLDLLLKRQLDLIIKRGIVSRLVAFRS